MEGLTGEQIARAWLEHSPFVRHLGVRLESLAPDEAHLVLPFQESLPTTDVTVHGGAIAALVDIAATAAAWSGARLHGPIRGTTVSLSVDMMRASRGEDVRARGRALRRGTQLHFCEVDLTRPDGALVAKGIVTYKIG